MSKTNFWIKPVVLYVVIALLLAGLVACYFLLDRPVTTVILVRHAEKNIEADNPNPALSQAGRERAHGLIKILGKTGITAVYATQYQRTQATAGPVANSVGLKVNQVDASNVAELVRQIKANDEGGVVLVAGHNNSVPAIIAALGGERFPIIPEDEYDNMFIVTLQRFRRTSVVKLKYGSPTTLAAGNQQTINQ